MNKELENFVGVACATNQRVELFVSGADFSPKGVVREIHGGAAFLDRKDPNDITSGSFMWVDMNKVWGWRLCP